VDCCLSWAITFTNPCTNQWICSLKKITQVGHLVNIILTSPLPSWMREGLQVGEIDTIDITTRNRIRVRGRLSNDGFAPPFSVSFGIAVYVTI
jgi:hypothetical protein